MICSVEDKSDTQGVIRVVKKSEGAVVRESKLNIIDVVRLKSRIDKERYGLDIGK